MLRRVAGCCVLALGANVFWGERDGCLPARGGVGLADHVVIRNEQHLLRLLHAVLASYDTDRTHLSPGKRSATTRTVCRRTSPGATVASLSPVGGLHHRKEGRRPLKADGFLANHTWFRAEISPVPPRVLARSLARAMVCRAASDV